MTPDRQSDADTAHVRSAAHKSRRLVLATVVVALLVGATALALPSIKSSLKTTTTREPERFTELYFIDSRHLPKTYAPGQSQKIRFALHNLEGQNVTYSYITYINGKPTGPQKTIFVPSEATTPITETINLATTDPRVEVTIKLINTNQSIHYWTEKES